MAISEWYDHTTYPSTGAAGSSSAARAEFEAIQNGISAKLPDLSGNGGEIVAVNSGATALEAITTTGSGSGVRATSPTLVTPILGVPTSGTLTNCTGLPVATGVSGLGTGVATFLATPSSANLASAVTDETGSGALVFATNPTLGAFTASGAITGSDSQATRLMLIDMGYTFLDKGNSGTTTQDLAYTGGSHQKITATGNFTITTSAWPPTGNLGVMLLELVNGGAHTITWPTINWVKPDGTTTTTFSTWIAAVTGRTALQSSGTDFIRLISRDAGTTIYGGFAL